MGQDDDALDHRDEMVPLVVCHMLVRLDQQDASMWMSRHPETGHQTAAGIPPVAPDAVVPHQDDSLSKGGLCLAGLHNWDVMHHQVCSSPVDRSQRVVLFPVGPDQRVAAYLVGSDHQVWLWVRADWYHLFVVVVPRPVVFLLTPVQVICAEPESVTLARELPVTM